MATGSSWGKVCAFGVSILPFSTTKAQMRDLQIQCIISGQTANLFKDSLVFVN